MADIMKMGKNPNYMGSWDLEELSRREVTLTIAQIRDEEVVTNGKSENCTVCHWTNKDFKPMILNVTNKKTLCKLYKTKDTEKLIGKAVIIGIDKVKAFGDIYDGLRIRKVIPTTDTANAPKCEECGSNILSASGMTAEQVGAYTKQKYGACLCGNCAAKRKAAQSK